MVPSELAKQVRMAAEGGSAAAQSALGGWHLRGEEGLEQDHVKAARGPRRKPGASSYTLTRLSLSLSREGGGVVPQGGRSRAPGRAMLPRLVLPPWQGVGTERHAGCGVGAQGGRPRPRMRAAHRGR